MDTRISRLLSWYRRAKRSLPWRATTDAYHIFVSELMLQQTQVDRVIPLYAAFLQRFPTWSALADASTSDLIHAWAGLGYNRRALFARDAAQAVVAHGVPTTEDGWRQLKGVGPYMAAALTEFVNHRRALVIDTNVRRVVGRLFLRIPYARPRDDARILQTLERITPHRGAHWDLPQAFMDLGSGTCLARIPRCDDCPMQSVCATRRQFNDTHLAETLRKKVTSKPRERIHAEKKFPDRIYRGRILAHIRTHGATPVNHLGTIIDPTFDPAQDMDWIYAMTNRLVADGMLAFSDHAHGTVRLA